MDSGETRGTKSWLRVRHWRDCRSGAATRETCLLMCVCVSVHEASGKQGDPGASYWIVCVQGGSVVSVFVCVWVSVREGTSKWRRMVALRHLYVQVPAAEVTRDLSAGYWID